MVPRAALGSVYGMTCVTSKGDPTGTVDDRSPELRDLIFMIRYPPLFRTKTTRPLWTGRWCLFRAGLIGLGLSAAVMGAAALLGLSLGFAFLGGGLSGRLFLGSLLSLGGLLLGTGLVLLRLIGLGLLFLGLVSPGLFLFY